MTNRIPNEKSDREQKKKEVQYPSKFPLKKKYNAKGNTSPIKPIKPNPKLAIYLSAFSKLRNF